MKLKDKYCYKCANQYTMKGCLTCFGGKHFKAVPKIDTSKLHLSESGEIISEENHIPKEFSQLNLPSKEIKERCTKELKEACKRLGLQLGDFTFKVMLAVYWEGKKQGLKEGDMHALDYTLIHFGDNDALKTEVESLKKCLRGIVYMAESGLHTKNEFAFARRIAEAKELCKIRENN